MEEPEPEKDMMELDVNLDNRLISNEKKDSAIDSESNDNIKKSDNDPVDDPIVETIEVGDNAVEDDAADAEQYEHLNDDDDGDDDDDDDDEERDREGLQLKRGNHDRHVHEWLQP